MLPTLPNTVKEGKKHPLFAGFFNPTALYENPSYDECKELTSEITERQKNLPDRVIAAIINRSENVLIGQICPGGVVRKKIEDLNLETLFTIPVGVGHGLRQPIPPNDAS